MLNLEFIYTRNGCDDPHVGIIFTSSDWQCMYVQYSSCWFQPKHPFEL